MQSIIWALIAAIGYGISSPLAKIAFNKELHTHGFTFSYGIALILFSAPSIIAAGGFGVIFPTTGALWFGIASGGICALGLMAHAEALSIKTSLVSVVAILAATYPLISSAISLPLMGEAEKLEIPRLLIGAVLIIMGGYLTATSIK
ncbi:hypothetical protein KKC45_02230 [Patescibacteria group bacterium]|nr:hypothetical protein [Patescibacteria group bacterium]